jgi:hypothetical protein
MQSTAGTGQKLKAQYICVRWGECGALEPLPEHPDLIVAQNAIARGARIIGLQARCGVGLNDVSRERPAVHGTDRLSTLLGFSGQPLIGDVSQSSRTSRRLSSAAGISSFDASARFRRLSISARLQAPAQFALGIVLDEAGNGDTPGAFGCGTLLLLDEIAPGSRGSAQLVRSIARSFQALVWELAERDPAHLGPFDAEGEVVGLNAVCCHTDRQPGAAGIGHPIGQTIRFHRFNGSVCES